MQTGLFALILLVVRTSESSSLTIDGKSLSVEKGANVSTVSNTIRGVSIIECVGKCMLGTCNMVGYHKPTKTCFISTDMSYDAISVSDPSYRVIKIPGRFISQWVEGVLDFSSEYTSTRWSASKIVGEADAYLSSDNSWSPQIAFSNDFIEVYFSTAVNVTSLEIYEMTAGGVVTAIKCFQDGAYHSLYVGDPKVLDVARIFLPILV